MTNWRRSGVLSGLAMLLSLGTPGPLLADSIFGFDWTLNGSSTTDGMALTLTPNAAFLAGSAFITSPLSLDANTSFHAFFVFNIDGGNSADGLTFTVQNDANGVNALGAVGGAFGYAGPSPSSPGITPSLAVEFDTSDNGVGDPDGNHVGIDQDGALVESLVTATPSFSLRGGDRFAWIDYEGATNTLSVFLSTTAVKPAAPLVSFTFALDLNVQLGSQAFVGFTAGTGLLTDVHKVQQFSFSSVKPVQIDIKPQSFPNSINLGSAGVVPVSVFSSPTFDARQVDPETLTLAGASVRMIGKGTKYSCAVNDVNGDNLPDLLCHVETVQFLLQPGDSKATLEASTYSGQAITGEDSIQIVP